VIEGMIEWEPEIGKRSLRGLYRGLVLTVYTGTVQLRGMISWQVEAWQEGLSPDVPAAEWDIAITGLAEGVPAAKLAAERCASKLLEAIAMIELARLVGDCPTCKHRVAPGDGWKPCPKCGSTKSREPSVEEPPSAADSEPGVL